MKDLLKNEWFVGTACGLLSALIAGIGSRIISIIKHRRRIWEANSFVTTQLRTFIVNGGSLSFELIAALRSSAARKFRLKEKEILPPLALLEDISAEIVGNIYLRIDQQEDMLQKINEFICDEKQLAISDEFDYYSYPSDIRKLAAMGMASLALITSALYILLTKISNNSFSHPITLSFILLGSFVSILITSYPFSRK